MNIPITHFTTTVLLLFSFCISSAAQASSAQKLFTQYSDRLYQIKVIEKLSNRKSAIGSGFLVSSDGLLVTNYHVISKFIHEPDKYYLQAMSINNQVESVTVEDFDVINDLALIKFSGKNKPYLNVSAKTLRKGDPIFSMGNPLDLGTAVVPGTYNGFTKQSYYQRIHFTGAINSGMSGGPVLNSRGDVVGVNVATAGNQVGFLVVAEKLLNLMNEYQQRKSPVKNYQQRINEQLLKNQKILMSTVLSANWKTVALGDAKVLGEIAPFIPCWGDKNRSNRNNKKYFTVKITCSPKETVYINQGLRTGMIEVQYRYSENISLTSSQFSSLLAKLYAGAGPGNRASEKDVTEYVCHEGFIDKPDERAVLCSRAYKKYTGLYDVLYISTTLGDTDKGLISHFTLSGVDKDMAKRFARRFMESSQWN